MRTAPRLCVTSLETSRSGGGSSELSGAEEVSGAEDSAEGTELSSAEDSSERIPLSKAGEDGSSAGWEGDSKVDPDGRVGAVGIASPSSRFPLTWTGCTPYRFFR